MENYRLNPVASRGTRKNIQITPELLEESIDRDLELCQRLISSIFDPEKEVPNRIHEQIQEYAGRFLTKTQHLDLLILYLRRVHSYCFYCGEEYDDERTLAAKCGPQHIRNASKINKTLIDLPNWDHSRVFEEKYLRAATERIERGVKELLPPTEDRLLKEMKQEYVEKKTEILAQGSIYQCGNCEKKFKTAEFVHKHFFNKHEDVLDQRFNKRRFEMMIKENYLNDPRKLVNTPSFGGAQGRDFRGGYGSGGRGGFRGGRDNRDGRGYIDHDDPMRNQQLQNPER